MAHTVLTPEQKLEALALKYYGGLHWVPKAGDYYTTCRNDLELYQIVREDETHLYTKYCDRECDETPWTREEFLTDFGVFRVYVPITVLEKLASNL